MHYLDKTGSFTPATYGTVKLAISKSKWERSGPGKGDGSRQGERRIEWPSESNKGNSSPGIRLYIPQE